MRKIGIGIGAATAAIALGMGATRILVVCDEDRSPSTFPKNGGGSVTRRADQGVMMIVELSGLP